MTAARAFNRVGMTVPDIDRAIDWYGAVLGFQLIYRRTLEHRPAVPEVREIFGPRLGRAHQAHMLGANGVGLEIRQSSIRRTISATTKQEFSSLCHRSRSRRARRPNTRTWPPATDKNLAVP
jgi:hypothetical protein